MVEYGKAMERARRPGWESAYLDYSGLKKIIAEIEGILWSKDPEQSRLIDNGPFVEVNMGGRVISSDGVTQHVAHLKDVFFQKLHVEIEKVSLFTLKKKGQLADAVGAARFEDTGLFDKKAVKIRPTRNNLDMYAALSVEMTHLMKFVFINATGVQKILKKYNKIFERMDEPHAYFVESDHLKQLVNSQSVLAIYASFQAVLEDCYHRENVTNPETALALLRFQCIMECTSILRGNAKLIEFPFLEFLSKKSMIVTGADFGGMDGVGRRALQWLLKLEPEDMLQMDQSQLERMWHKWSAESEFVHSHLDGGLPWAGHRRVPTYTGDDAFEQAMEDLTTDDATRSKTSWGGVNGVSMILNLLSILLYTINYYIVAPTANSYAIQLGMDGAFGATLIGASSFSALFSAFVYSLWYTRSTFKSALIFSATCPLVGNLIYSLAISYESMPFAIFGRVLCGFGSAEVLNRQLISTSVRFEDMTQASALFVAFGASGMSIGPLIAGILDMTAGRDMRVDLKLPFTPAGGVVYNHITAPGFVMAFLWLLQLIGLISLFHEPIRLNTAEQPRKEDGSGTPKRSDAMVGMDESALKIIESGSSSDLIAYGSIMNSQKAVEPYKTTKCIGPKEFWNELVTTWNLVFQNAGLPLTLLIFAYIEMADEVIISSCSMVVRRYFGWHGSTAGFFIASLGALVIPAHFVVEKASKRISERKILLVSSALVVSSIPGKRVLPVSNGILFYAQRSLVAIVVCVVGIFNYSGMLYDVLGSIIVNEDETADEIKETKLEGIKVKHILTNAGEIYYNWGNGIPFYVIFLSLLFMATIVLEGVDTSIMAKVTPPQLNEKFVNGGLLATLIGTLGRVVADSILTGTLHLW
jgi:predicted ThiF/HesA family dinucleotide-utilizing enzyme